MKEMLKNKMIIGFAVVMLGMVFIDSSRTARLERREDKKEDVVVMVDMK